MDPQWARSLRNQCDAARVAFFFKQWGAWSPRYQSLDVDAPGDFGEMIRLGKKKAGRMLDAREWSEVPS